MKEVTPWMGPAAPFRSKMFLTWVVGVLVVAIGMVCQYRYDQRKIRYKEIIAQYYHKYLGREPDAIGERRWLLLALNRWGLKKVERIGFIEAKKQT